MPARKEDKGIEMKQFTIRLDARVHSELVDRLGHAGTTWTQFIREVEAKKLEELRKKQGSIKYQ